MGRISNRIFHRWEFRFFIDGITESQQKINRQDSPADFYLHTFIMHRNTYPRLPSFRLNAQSYRAPKPNGNAHVQDFGRDNVS